ncbi:chaperone protein dnaJ 11, chloroplastic [Arachis stenosperma]|uniref:chaperone protein dnaJ 11, chloroplastic n=1 Tax=Arachis stenosperma TaxID=217475 RepID=UPI0025AC2CA7|nr:chaperone protein dnaJ 11, chloroplastic [Arachis stenosperma]
MPAILSLSTVPAVKFSFSCNNRASNKRFRRRSPIHAVASPVPATSASLYEVLRVEQDASLTEIKSAFRSLAKLYHPDVAAVRRLPDSDGGSGTDDGDFIVIRNAYETLSDSSARAMYDLSLSSRRRRFPEPLSVKRNSDHYSTRRWETDQCW